jgi:Fe-S-cluster containining protein
MLRHCHVEPLQSGSRVKDPTDCTTCDAVCCRLTVVLEPGDDIPHHLSTRLPEGYRVMARNEDGWCVAMDREHMNCSIYGTRPAVCRRFFMGGPYCRAIRSDYETQRSRSIPITLK